MIFLKRGIYLIIFCLPLYLVRLEIFKIPTTVLELLIYALFVLWLVKRGYRGLWTALKHERLLVWGIVLLLLGVSIATFFSQDFRLSAGIWKAWFVDAILFFLMFITIIKKEDMKKVFNSLILSGFVVAVISLIYLICGNLNYQGRLQGIFNSPNYLAMYLAVPLILSIANICLHKDTCRSRNAESHSISADCGRLPMRSLSQTNIRLFLYLVSCVLSLVILFFTKSFGVLFGLMGAGGFGLIAYLYQKNKKKIALGIIILGFILVFAIGLWKIQSLEGLKSFDARFVIWEKAIDAFVRSPFTGIGPGTFESYFPPYPKWGVPQPHNIFLAFLIQAGLVGLVGFILILIWFYKNNAKNLALLCLMTYVLAHGLVDTTYWKNDLSLMFWTIIGIAVVLQFYRIKQPVSFIDKE
jgi:O-antigen ligase